MPSSITAEATVVFARCCDCACKFVTDYRTVTYSAAPTSEAPLRFYVEQGAGLEFLARSVFVAAQLPVVNYLDVGCGFGFGLDMAKRIFGWNAIGLDPGALAAAGRDMLGVTIKDELLSSLEGTYDAIVATEVLEHIAHPHAFLSEVHARLSPTGTFILSTPNAGYLDTESNGDLLMPILSPGYHSVLYTAEGLTNLLRRSGFGRVKISKRLPVYLGSHRQRAGFHVPNVKLTEVCIIVIFALASMKYRRDRPFILGLAIDCFEVLSRIVPMWRHLQSLPSFALPF